MTKNIFLFLILFPSLLIAQTQISGIIVDSKSKKPLPFATIVTNSNAGSLADVEGKFLVQTRNPFNQITISYVGYKSVVIPINQQDRFIRIELEAAVENLSEVIITARENPALQIIRNAIANKSKNDIEKSLNSFKFNAYNKILVTANPDSISGKIDSVFTIKDGTRTFIELDSNNYNFKKEIEKQHFFITEKISEFQFQKGKKKKETILASRMAGLQQPIYEFVAVTIQDFSFYKEHYTVVGTKYTNPIAKSALKHYNYKILDTVSNGLGQSYMIYYKPKINKEFLGIEGVLYLDSESFAITKAIAELKGGINVKASQDFKYYPSGDIWFPEQMNIVLRKGDNNQSIKLFGATIKMGTQKKNDSILNTAEKNPEDVSYFISKTVNSNIKINIPTVVKSSASTIEFNDDAHKKTQEFWELYRTDSLTKRGERTYHFLDSIAKEEGVEKKINLARNILKGYYPTKYVNLNLGKILNLNNYEGLRLGFGGETNSNFSPIFKINSYVAFGTKDKDFKYRVGASTRLNKSTNTWFGVDLTNDLKEAAALNFIAENNSFSPVNPRNLNIDKFYNYQTISAFLVHDIQPNLEAKLQFSSGEYKPVFDYQFISSTKNFTIYNLTTATLGFQYNPKNEYMNSPIGKLKTKNEFPQFTFQFTKSIENLMEGDFDFTQLNLRISHKIKRLRRATTTFLFESGKVIGDAPISHLFNATPNYTFKSPWVKRITFAGRNSFETMGYNEFISDQFASLHIKHELIPFKISKKFRPQLTIATRAAIGDIEKPFHHYGFLFSKMNKGYFESGLEFNSLFKGFGLSAFYRYGPYQHSEWSDNLALKLTFKIRLGF